MIRKITPADRQIYVAMATDFYSSDAVCHAVDKKHFDLTFDELMRSDTYAEGYIFESDGAVSGYALLAKTFSQEAGGIVIWIEEIYIKPEFRGMGQGKEFLKSIISRLGHGITRVRLEASACNSRAVKLYRSLGFTDLEYGQLIIDGDQQ